MKYQVIEQYVRDRTQNEKGWFIDFGHRSGRSFNDLAEASRHAQSIIRSQKSKDTTIYIVDMSSPDTKTIEAWICHEGVVRCL